MGWVGGAPVLIEILSPDGERIIIHTLRHPNSLLIPSFTVSDFGITATVSKTSADATSVSISCACWAAGTTSNPAEAGTDTGIFDLTNAVQTVKNGAGKLYGLSFYNRGNNNAYVQIFDLAGTVTLGTTPPKLSFGCNTLNNFGQIFDPPINIEQSLKIAASTLYNNATAPNQNVIANLTYI